MYKMLIIPLLAVALGAFTYGCAATDVSGMGDSDSDSDSDGDSDSDTDTDTGSDTGSDTGTGTDPCPPTPPTSGPCSPVGLYCDYLPLTECFCESFGWICSMSP
jgi:hypothetical protein